MIEVKKIGSGCFRTIEYANVYCRISSYLRSMAAKGYNPRVAIQITLDGNAAHLLMASEQAPD